MKSELSAVSDLLTECEEKIKQNRIFTIRILPMYFPQISCSSLHEKYLKLLSLKPSFRKLCARWVAKGLIGHQRETSGQRT